MLSAHYPGNQWTQQSMDAYARAIEPWDAAITTRALARAVTECEFYPKVSVLREFVRIEKRMAEPEPPIERMLNDTPSNIVPLWVKGWCVSRYRHGDMRTWAEQERIPDIVVDPMPSSARDEYIEEGSSLSSSQLFQVVFGV